jgi:hypothetical protein
MWNDMITSSSWRPRYDLSYDCMQGDVAWSVWCFDYTRKRGMCIDGQGLEVPHYNAEVFNSLAQAQQAAQYHFWVKL